MTNARTRTVTAILGGAAVLLALTACAPAVHHLPGTSTVSSSKPKVTPTARPVANTQPKSDYPFTCGDAVSASTLTALFPVSMTAISGAKLSRVNSYSGMPGDSFVEGIGGLDCAWYDGTPAVNNGTQRGMHLTLIPATTAQWNSFVESYGETPVNNAFAECGTDPSDYNCTYDAYVNGTWFELTTDSMRGTLPGGSDNTLPTTLKTVATAVATKLTAAAAAEPNGPQKGSKPLPSQFDQLISSGAFLRAMGLPATTQVSIGCTGYGDGPIPITAIAADSLLGAGHSSCNFDTPDGGSYGYYSALPGGAWAATLAIAATPGEKSDVLVNQPEGSALYSWVDSDGGQNADLIFRGSWITVTLFAPDSVGEAVGSVPPATAVQNVASAASTTIG
jgi:hypothetical protein